ncbi:MAG: hypothetical protein ACR2G9_10490 [Gaiellaceae bacterium]
MLTIDERDGVRERLLRLAQTDPCVIAAAARMPPDALSVELERTGSTLATRLRPTLTELTGSSGSGS